MTVEEVLASRMIAKPLRFLNACPLADGGAAVILCSRDKLKSQNKVVTVAAATLATGIYNSTKIHNPDHVKVSVEEAYQLAGYGPEDMDVVQAYDTMSPGELWDLEKLGFCKKGEASHLLQEGYFDLSGKLPVNTDGGLMSRGHPLGATALAQVMRFIARSGARQASGRFRTPK